MDWLAEAEKNSQRIIAYRRHFHTYPELSGQENETANFIASRLTELGLEVKTGIGAPMPGVVGLLKGDKAGRTVALRADMDALPIMEATNLPYRSIRDGVMHACGHDAHMAMLLGAAELLSQHADLLAGSVKFIFQPSEESGKEGGAVPMIRDGAMDGVNAIFGVHVDPEYNVGNAVVSFGQTMAASDNIIIRITGKSGHAAMPHLAVDAVTTTAHVIIALQTAMTRMKDSQEAGVLSFGRIDGGTRENIIAETVCIKGILRTLNPLVREYLLVSLQQVAKNIAASFGASCEFICSPVYDALVNDLNLANVVQETAKRILGSNRVLRQTKPKMSTEDFSHYLRHVPGAFYFLGCVPTVEQAIPLHNTQFVLDEAVLPIGAAMQAALACNYLSGEM